MRETSRSPLVLTPAVSLPLAPTQARARGQRRRVAAEQHVPPLRTVSTRPTGSGWPRSAARHGDSTRAAQGGLGGPRHWRDGSRTRTSLPGMSPCAERGPRQKLALLLTSAALAGLKIKQICRTHLPRSATAGRLSPAEGKIDSRNTSEFIASLGCRYRCAYIDGVRSASSTCCARACASRTGDSCVQAACGATT